MSWLGQFVESPGESPEAAHVSKPDIRRAELETSIPPVLLTESKTTEEVSQV